MVACSTPDTGRILGVAFWLLDDCMAPVYGTASGYWDDCPAAVNPTDNIDEGEPFTRRCSSGRIKRHIPGERSLESIGVDVDMHWFDSEWLVTAGLASPIMNNAGDVVGWADGTNDSANVLVGVALEILGGDVCAGDDPGCNVWWKLYPLKNARITEEGELGKEDSFIRLTGETVDTAELGAGPMPLDCNEDGEAEYFETCLPSGQHRYQFTGGPVPTECGSFDTVEPVTPCTPSS